MARVVAVASFIVTMLGATAEARPLLGSRASLERQNQVARDHRFAYLRTSSDVRKLVKRGVLVSVRPSRTLELAAVSFPYAQPETALFVERLSAQYQRACGEKLVVTSLTRPRSRQPRNASSLSVHPTGMAVDLRRSRRSACRRWLERTLIALEGAKVLEATRERRPPHYHIAVFPKPYAAYVARIGGVPKVAVAHNEPRESPAAAEIALVPKPRPKKPRVKPVAVVAKASHHAGSSGESTIWFSKKPAPANVEATAVDAIAHRVQDGESLWKIAQRYGTTTAWIRDANGLARARIYPGQILRVPAAGFLASR